MEEVKVLAVEGKVKKIAEKRRNLGRGNMDEGTITIMITILIISLIDNKMMMQSQVTQEDQEVADLRAEVIANSQKHGTL
jgi:hypothetical protein